MTLAALTFAVIAACPDAPPPREVDRVLGPLPAALLSVTSAPDQTLWVAGATDSDGAFLAFRSPASDRFERLDLRHLDPAPGPLWWVHASATGVAAVGEYGRVFIVDQDTPRRVPTPSTAALYGVAGETTLYAVGGPPATLLRITPAPSGDDDEVALVALPESLPPDLRLFKIHFDGARFHIVGERGAYLVLTETDGGPSIDYRPIPGRPRLITVHGPPGACVAVGGQTSAYAVALGDPSPRLLPPGPHAPLSGVFVGRETFAVGFLGLLLERIGDGWRVIPGLDPGFDAHAVHVDRSGVAWVVGGRLLDGSLRGGALWRVGPGQGSPLGTSTLDALDGADSSSGDASDATPTPHACATLAAASSLELGQRDHAGCFTAYADGDPALAINGPQGGSHVEVALRFPGQAARVDLSLSLVVDAVTVARFEASGFPTEVDAFDRQARITTDLPVIFAGADPSAWIGREATLEATLVESGGPAPRTLTARVRLLLAR